MPGPEPGYYYLYSDAMCPSTCMKDSNSSPSKPPHCPVRIMFVASLWLYAGLYSTLHPQCVIDIGKRNGA